LIIFSFQKHNTIDSYREENQRLSDTSISCHVSILSSTTTIETTNASQSKSNRWKHWEKNRLTTSLLTLRACSRLKAVARQVVECGRESAVIRESAQTLQVLIERVLSVNDIGVEGKWLL
jgi:transposase-like protein